MSGGAAAADDVSESTDLSKEKRLRKFINYIIK